MAGRRKSNNTAYTRNYAFRFRQIRRVHGDCPVPEKSTWDGTPDPTSLVFRAFSTITRSREFPRENGNRRSAFVGLAGAPRERNRFGFLERRAGRPAVKWLRSAAKNRPRGRGGRRPSSGRLAVVYAVANASRCDRTRRVITAPPSLVRAVPLRAQCPEKRAREVSSPATVWLGPRTRRVEVGRRNATGSEYGMRATRTHT